jgi:hypothetical protein
VGIQISLTLLAMKTRFSGVKLQMTLNFFFIPAIGKKMRYNRDNESKDLIVNAHSLTNDSID